MKRNTREILFFMASFLLFFLMVKLNDFWIGKFMMNQDVILSVSALCFTLVLVGVYYIANLHSLSENFWDVSPGAQCRGGPYTWQGNSERSKMCRSMAETPEGRAVISSYSCPSGYNGVPKIPFVFAPLSGDDWKNEQCTKDSDVLQDVGLCGFENQVVHN
jgi:hypothetical protein